MSLCVGIIKTVGVSSLGLYTGLLASTYIVSKTDDTSLTTKKIICKLSKICTVLLSVSSIFLGIGYFRVPLAHKQPFTLYGFLVGPLTLGYGLMIRNLTNCCKGKKDSKNTTPACCPVSGNKEGQCPASKTAAVCKNTITCGTCPVGLSTHILLLLLGTIPVFSVNVLGLYGEGVL